MDELEALANLFHKRGYNAMIRSWSLGNTVAVSSSAEILTNGVKKLGGLVYVLKEGPVWTIRRCNLGGGSDAVVHCAGSIDEIVELAILTLEKSANKEK